MGPRASDVDNFSLLRSGQPALNSGVLKLDRT
jgi:hypothetical protein